MSKSIRLTVLASLALAWLCGSALGQGGVTSSTKNPAQIAILHWYPANLTTTFQAGTFPNSVAFDGASIWIASPFGLTKLRPSDGAVLATVTNNNLGSNDCRAMVYDGANLWVACTFITGTILDKVRARDGAVLRSTLIDGPGPGSFLAFDGANIWVPKFQRVAVSSVTKVRASDGAVIEEVGVGSTPNGVVSDGVNIWVANGADNNVMKVRASDGAVLGTFSVGMTPLGMAFDGANIWVANADAGTITKLRASDGATLGTFSVGAGSAPFGVAFDGANIWVTNERTASVTELRASDGTVLGTFPVGSGPQGVLFDGTSIWVASSALSKL